MKAPVKLTNGRWGPIAWKAPDMEWLEHQYLELGESAKAIAAKVGCSEWKAQQWVRDAGWRKPVRVSGDSLAPMRIGRGVGTRFAGVSREWLFQQYVENDKTTVQIADEIGATNRTIGMWLIKHGIPVKMRDTLNVRHSVRMLGEGNPAWQGGTARNYQVRLLSESGREYICEWCSETKELQVHHLDHSVKNGNLENLAWMCRHCNMVEAHLWALEKKELATWEYQDGQLLVKFRRE